MKFPSYTNRKRTKEYILELEKFSDELEGHLKKELAREEDLGAIDLDLPKVKKGDVFLVMDVDAFCHGYSPISSMENYQQVTEHAERNEYFFKLVNKTFLVKSICRGIKVIDKKNHIEEVHRLSADINIIEPSPLEYEIVCEDKYVFLPHPKEIPKFKKFLPFFSRKPEKLEKILDRYYSKLGLPNY